MGLDDFKFGRDNTDFSLKIRRTRRLRARWTPELAQDIQAYHNIDAEAELTRLLSEEIARTIDNQIINELISAQPLTQPEGRLFYMDFIYEDKFNFKFGR